MTEQVYELFQNPTNAFRGKPFWSWNGKLEKEELLRQIHVLKDMGFGGFFMHSRTGLVTEYLGEEWFELINACADEAAKLGLEAWLYDEDRWPSGTAGGMVTRESRYRLKFIRLTVVETEAFRWSEAVLAAFVCRLEGIACYEARQLAEGEFPTGRNGQSVLVFTVEEMEKESFYNGFTYVDTMNREATERYLELTHERYLRYSGDRFGTSIKGVFTDEPHRGALLDGFGVSNREAHWLVPWTPALFDTFRQTFGYDLIPRLPELFLQLEGRSISQVKWHYTELLQQLFLDNFARPVREWCNRHGLILTGHILHEDSLTAQTAMSGSMMRYYEHMDYPGVDVLTEGNRAYWIVKQLASAARQLGRKWLLSELYGCTGWQMPFEGHKAVGDWQALFGINVRCHHLSWYTMEGEAKRDYPASIAHQSAWWKEYESVETYFSRLGVVLSEGKPRCDVLVINPVESVWCQVYPGWSRNLGAKSPEVQRLERMYQDMFHWLAGAQLDFDYGDEEMMSRLASVERDERNLPVLRVGEAVYRKVLVAGMTTIRSTTIELLRRFADSGGRVVFAGEPPAYVDALQANDACRLAQAKGVAVVPLEEEAIVACCVPEPASRVSVTDAGTGERLKDIYCQVREDGDCFYVVLLNVNREQWYRGVSVTLGGTGSVQEWKCSTGERLPVDFTVDGDGCIRLVTDFPPGGEHVFVLDRSAKVEAPITGSTSVLEREEPVQVAVLHGPFDYRLSEPNILVLDQADYRIGDEAWQGEAEILKVDRALRRRFGLPYRGGSMIQPWFAANEAFEGKGELTLRFDFDIDTIPEGPVELVVERPERYVIRLGGKRLGLPKQPDWWVDRSMIRVPVPKDALKPGPNSLLLETTFHQGIDLEAVYLIGPFGVKLNGSRKTITELPSSLTVGDLTLQGLPFYTGEVAYIVKPPADLGAMDGNWLLSVDSYSGACIKVHSAEGGERIIGWHPYVADISTELRAGSTIELKVVLTRRNTFGPLHIVPTHHAFYGPGSFVTEGNNFSDNYTLIPSGLLEAPKVLYRRAGTGAEAGAEQ